MSDTESSSAKFPVRWESGVVIALLLAIIGGLLALGHRLTRIEERTPTLEFWNSLDNRVVALEVKVDEG